MHRNKAQDDRAPNQPAERQRGRLALQPPQCERLAQLSTMAESGPQAGLLAQLEASANNSAHIAAQRKAISAIHSSQNMTAQRQQLSRLTGAGVRREAVDKPLPQVSQREAAPAKLAPDGHALQPVEKTGNSMLRTVQRTVTQITPGREGKIGTVLIVGRPERVFGNSMGDHTTAFATHVEAIKLRMEGRTLGEAWAALSDMYAAAKKLPGYDELKGDLPTDQVFHFGRRRPHGNRLDDAETELTRLLGALQTIRQEAKVDWQTVFALMLQRCVNAYLEFRELIPLSAINVMSVSPALAGKGKGESGHAGMLGQYERGKASTTVGLKQAIEGAFDVHAAAMVVATTDAWALSALAPGITFEHKPRERAELLAKQHAMAIRDGFPKSYQASGFDPNHLAEAILEQAKSQMAKEKERLLRRYAIRKADVHRYTEGIEAGVYTTVDDVEERDRLKAELDLYREQIEGIDEALKEKTELPGESAGINLVEESEPTVDKAETKKAERAENEALEEEVKKQPVATQIVFSDDVFNKIHTIEIEGRPPSPISGSMGAHSTAWLVHTDRVKKALSGASVPDALKIMNETLVPEARQLQTSLAKASPPTAEGQVQLAKQAWARLEARKTKKAEDYGSSSTLAFELQQYVNELLTYINYIPGVTREAVDTTGHGEGAHRKVLVEFEKKFAKKLADIGRDAKKKTKGSWSRKVRSVVSQISETECRKLKRAVDGLLDVNGLSSKKVYRQAHRELIKKTYPYVYEVTQAA